jgi:hypothetical protein
MVREIVTTSKKRHTNEDQLCNSVYFNRIAIVFIHSFVYSPKHFSVQGGMGAALLRKPEQVKDV